MNGPVQSMSPEDQALAFLKQYAQANEYFTADQACDAYKAAGLPEPAGGKGWRDKWGAMMKRAEGAEWVVKAGKTKPTSSSTHATTTALWMSRLFKGERTLLNSGLEYCKDLRKAWVTRQETDLLKLLMKASDHGYELGLAAGKGEKAAAKKNEGKGHGKEAGNGKIKLKAKDQAPSQLGPQGDS